jgi:YfiH family protein
MTAPPYLTAATIPARHGFFTRNGGTSAGPYASLNCSFSGGDEVETVRRNRAAAAQALGLAPEHLLGLKQTHGTTVITVQAPWPVGTGAQADAMVTATPGLALGIITADCAPVLFSADDGGIIGAAHAGWRGALAGILEATVDAMQALGAKAITAAIGPCIQQPSYEVAADLHGPILARDPNDMRFFAPGTAAGRWQFDLPGYCAGRLAALGIAAEILPHDTCAEPETFFSHRRRTLRGEPAIGHQISVIRI